MEMRKGFTLIELVVAVAILAMVISFSTVVFKVSIKAQRIASANMEIMQKMRAITDQLNADFKGFIKDAPSRVKFDDAESYKDNKLHYFSDDDKIKVSEDSILFFASGDFQSTGQYVYDGDDDDRRTVIGAVACIYYGIADVTSYKPEEEPDPKKKVLVRRQTILIGDDKDDNWNGSGELTDWQEYCEESLAEAIADPNFDPNDASFMARPELDPYDDDANDLAMYMAKGVDDFTIELAEWASELKWEPEDSNSFDDCEDKDIETKALKFSFTIYDSRGVIEKGRRFTHIVYLKD